MRTVLFVSPHLDDAVFSCALRMVREAEAGARVHVATVFSHGHGSPSVLRRYAARRNEDRIALDRLGAIPLWMGLMDAPFRTAYYNSFQRIVLGTAPGDECYIWEIRQRLERLLSKLRPETVYLPLGVGTHIDHRLVFQAGFTRAVPGRKYFYEEQPYSWVRFATEARLQEIGAAPQDALAPMEAPASAAQRKAAFLRSFRSAPYVQRYLPPGKERRDCETELIERLERTPVMTCQMQAELETDSGSNQTRIVRALCSYRSQVRAFLGERQALLEASANHARSLGSTGWRAERFWKCSLFD